MPSVPFRSALACAACSGTLAVGAVPALAAPSWVRGEQIDRGDGPSGTTTPWAVSTPGRSFAVTDDGRFAYLSYPTGASTRGLFRRDVQRNTTQLVLDGVEPTGATSTRTTFSVLTRRALTGADGNASNDLYLVDPLTGAATLASSTPSGASVGDLTAGAVTADGTAVVYSRGGATYRRDLASASATQLAAAPLAVSAGTPNLSDTGLSADGRTAILAGDSVATAAGTRSLATSSSYSGLSMVSSDGSTALRVVADAATGAFAVRVTDLATGAARTVVPRLGVGAYGFDVLRLSPDGRQAIATAGFPLSPIQPGVTGQHVIGTVDLATGAVATTSGDLPTYAPRVLSPNGRFGVTESASHSWIVPTALGASLPGGTDGAAPWVYADYAPGCANPPFWLPSGGRATVTLMQGSAYYVSPYAVPVGRISGRVTNASTGAVLGSFAISASAVQGKLPAYTGAVHIDLTTTFGTTPSSGRRTIPAYRPTACPQLPIL